MSRNFELLQQLNTAPASVSGNPWSGTSVSPATSELAIPAERCPASDPAYAAMLEEQRLVHRLFLDASPSPRAVVFTGLDADCGCTYLCSRSAELLASKTNSNVCVVDANLRMPSLHRRFEIENGPGLADALLDQGDVCSYARRQGEDGKLWVMTAGTELPDAYTLLASERLASLFSDLRKAFEYVLIDSPPASLYTDSLVLGALSDGVTLVLKANVSRRTQASKILEEFSATRVRVLGTVLNQRTFPVPQAIYDRL